MPKDNSMKSYGFSEFVLAFVQDFLSHCGLLIG